VNPLTPLATPTVTTVTTIAVPNPRWGVSFSGTDHRVAMEPTSWPWQALGRVNVASPVSRHHCTGALVGPQLVLTAGHCLFDHRLGRWVNPKYVHFVVGQARDRNLGHGKATELIIPPELVLGRGSAPQRPTMRRELMAHDWALIRLDQPLSVKPIPFKAMHSEALVKEAEGAEIARAGYSADRPYLLSVHRACAAGFDRQQPGVMLNHCDARPGDSGSPLLLFRGDEVFIVGLSSGAAFDWAPGTGYVALAGLGASSTSFADALNRALRP
jgi:protease YdgD